MRILSLLLVVAACGSDEIDLSGVYRVDSAIGSSPCGADATITYDAFIKFERMEIFGSPFFTYEGCTDEAATDCQCNGGIFASFAEPIDGGWRGTLTSSSSGGSSCLLGYNEQTAILRGSALTIEVSQYSEDVPGLSEEQCAPDEAERRNTSMMCEEHQLVEATRI